VARVAVIVVSWNTRELLAECLASVVETAGGLDVETVVVDNGSSDGSPEMVRERFPAARLIANADNSGFARANNQAIDATEAPWVLMLNSDAALRPGALQRLLACIEAAPRAGLVGAQLRYPDGAFQFSHARFPTLGGEALVLTGLGRVLRGPWYPSLGAEADGGARVVDWVGGACMLARREALRAVGGFDEGYFFYGEEVDLCYTLRRAGWEVWYEPAAVVTHHGAGSARRLATREALLYRSRRRFFHKHHGAASGRLLAAEIYLVTPPKIVLHGLLRRLSGGRRGRPVLSWRDLRVALADVGSDLRAGGASARRPAVVADARRGGAPAGARTLLIATTALSDELARDAAHAHYPRVDYIELRDRLGADVLDYGVYPRGRARTFIERLETELRFDPYLALQALRRLRGYDRAVCMSERAGIALAALRRAGAFDTSLAVLFQSWSHRQEAAVKRLGLFRAIDLIGVNTTALRDRFIALGAPPQRLHVFRWGIDHRFYAPRSAGAGPPFALTLGETRLRDYPLLFRAMEGLALELRVLAHGYASAREKRPRVFSRQPANVILMPRISYVDLRALYAQASFVVLPVLDVPQPIGLTAALEAMCMARAVIATRSRGLSDYLADGETCLLVDGGDAAALRDAIRRLATDPALARRLGENGRARVEAGLNQSRYVGELADVLGAAARNRAEAVA
jgi:GT2 family glycosyltransferase